MPGVSWVVVDIVLWETWRPSQKWSLLYLHSIQLATLCHVQVGICSPSLQTIARTRLPERMPRRMCHCQMTAADGLPPSSCTENFALYIAKTAPSLKKLVKESDGGQDDYYYYRGRKEEPMSSRRFRSYDGCGWVNYEFIPYSAFWVASSWDKLRLVWIPKFSFQPWRVTRDTRHFHFFSVSPYYSKLYSYS